MESRSSRSPRGSHGVRDRSRGGLGTAGVAAPRTLRSILAGVVIAALGPCGAGPSSGDVEPPAGVVLVEIDGGVDYFARWPDSFPTDPGFFPIALWGETLAEPGSIEAYRALGINTFVSLWPGAAYDVEAAIARAGMYLVDGIPDAREPPGDARAGWNFTDEPDGRYICDELTVAWLRSRCRGTPSSHTDAEAIASMANEVRRRGPGLPVLQQFTKPVARPGHVSVHDRGDLVTMARSGDIVSFDYYPLADPWDPGEISDLHDAVRRVRGLTGFDRPVWAFLETSAIFAENGVDHEGPTPEEIAAEAWHAIIGGARGLQYFNHNFALGNPKRPPTQHLLIEPEYRDIARGVRDLNARIARLAPVLAAPQALGVVRARGPVNVAVRFHDGAYTIFAATTSDRDATVRFEVTGPVTSQVEVLDEGRVLEITDGGFVDRFTARTGVHVYRIALGSPD